MKRTNVIREELLKDDYLLIELDLKERVANAVKEKLTVTIGLSINNQLDLAIILLFNTIKYSLEKDWLKYGEYNILGIATNIVLHIVAINKSIN